MTFFLLHINKYGISSGSPALGIILGNLLENYAPWGMMIGTDSHTPNAGGILGNDFAIRCGWCGCSGCNA